MSAWGFLGFWRYSVASAEKAQQPFVTIMLKVEKQHCKGFKSGGIASCAASNNVRDYGARYRVSAFTMPENIFRHHRGIQQKAAIRRCDTCNGRFGLIRHRFAQKQFCSKQCLDKYKSQTGREASVPSGLIFLEAPWSGSSVRRP